MGKTFSCNFGNCGFVVKKESELKKHILEHEDPSKVFRCTQCTFSSMYSSNLRKHTNTHSDEKPYACPDMVRVVASSKSGSSSQPLVSEKPCNYRSNCDSGLIKHRIKYHGYLPNPKRSLARRGVAASSQVDPQTTASSNDPFPVPPKGIINQASHSARAYPSVVFAPSHAGQPFDNNNHSVPDTRYGEVWNNNSYALAAGSINAYSSVASQNNHASRGVATLPFPLLPNNLATVSHHNSESLYTTSNGSAHASSEPPYNANFFTWSQASTSEAESSHSNLAAFYTADYYNSKPAGSYVGFPPSSAELPFNNRLSSHPDTLYGEASNNHAPSFAQEGTSAVVVQRNHADRGITTLPFPILPNGHDSDSESSYVTSDDSARTSPESLSDTTTLACSEKPSTPKADTTDSGSAASYTTHDGSLPHASPPSPAELPFNHDELGTLYGDASNDSGYTQTFAVEPIESNSSIVPQNNHADGSVTLLAPSSPPVLAPVLLETRPCVNDSSTTNETEIGPVLSDNETELHEDDIFFRGTGREGCLCPEMMIDAGVEGWDRSFMDY